MLYYENLGPAVSHTVAHLDCFIKVDIFYFRPEQLLPSEFTKRLRILHDPTGLIEALERESSRVTYHPSPESVLR